MDFEWDEEKRKTNLAKHGIDFPDAVRVFQDEKRLWGFDEGHSGLEDRWWTLGMTYGNLLLVVTTEREEMTRIISARKATRDEQRAYYQSFAD